MLLTNVVTYAVSAGTPIGNKQARAKVAESAFTLETNEGLVIIFSVAIVWDI